MSCRDLKDAEVWLPRCIFSDRCKADERRRTHHVNSEFRPEVEALVSRTALPQQIWTFVFRALWAVADAGLDFSSAHYDFLAKPETAFDEPTGTAVFSERR